MYPNIEATRFERKESIFYLKFATGKFSWLVGFYGISTFISYLMPNPFYVNNLVYSKQFSLA